MIPYAVTLSVVLAVLAFYQVVLAIVFFVRTRGQRAIGLDGSAAKAAVLLALRGADPGLALGLKRLIQQDYPDYELRIVVDSETDPAWALVHQVIRETGATHVHVSVLRERSTRCSLHCASLVQLAGELDESTPLFALADGDVVAHASWLRELVTPIIREEADATSGNRWYMPPQGQFGSMVRYVWNAASVVAMYFGGIPWGGTFAGRTGDLRRSGVIDKWKKALAVDAPIHDCWRELGLGIRFVPSLMMVNREECNLAGAFRFFSRQLTWTRLYQPRSFWYLIVSHAGITSAMMLAVFGFAAYGIWAGVSKIAAPTLGSLAGYLSAMVLSLVLLEFRVRSIARRRGDPVSWLSPGALLKTIVAIPVAQMVHLLAVVHVLTERRLNWRGVAYDIRSPFDVRKSDDRPFRQSGRQVDSPHSL